MFTITVSFKPNGSNAEVIAQIIKLLARDMTAGLRELRSRSAWVSDPAEHRFDIPNYFLA